MDKAVIPPGRIGDHWYNVILDPVVHLWRHDKPYFYVFAIANLLLGQLGLFFSGLFFIQSGIAFKPVWDETVSSGALYTFAIALIASVLATVAFEFVDGQRQSRGMELWQHKLGWGLIACLLIICQGGLVGSLLSTPREGAPAAQMTEARAALPQEPKAATPAPTEKPVSEQKPLESPKRASGSWLQVLLWVLSMAVATQIFCLTRLPFIRENYARQRTDRVNELTQTADGITQTSFGERL